MQFVTGLGDAAFMPVLDPLPPNLIGTAHPVPILQSPSCLVPGFTLASDGVTCQQTDSQGNVTTYPAGAGFPEVFIVNGVAAGSGSGSGTITNPVTPGMYNIGPAKVVTPITSYPMQPPVLPDGNNTGPAVVALAPDGTPIVGPSATAQSVVSSSSNSGSGSGSDMLSTLSADVSTLPSWVWLAIAGGVLLFMRGKK